MLVRSGYIGEVASRGYWRVACCAPPRWKALIAVEHLPDADRKCIRDSGGIVELGRSITESQRHPGGGGHGTPTTQMRLVALPRIQPPHRPLDRLQVCCSRGRCHTSHYADGDLMHKDERASANDDQRSCQYGGLNVSMAKCKQANMSQHIHAPEAV